MRREVVRTEQEFLDEIKALKKIRKRVRKTNNAGDPNRKIINAEITFLKTGELTYKKEWVYGEFSRTNVYDWVSDRRATPCSMIWEGACA